MKQNKFYRIYDFMMGELGLSGTKLLVYAYIYSFYEARRVCHSSRKYMAEAVDRSLRSVGYAIKELVDGGLIFKRTGYKSAEYLINEAAIKPLIKTNIGAKCENPELPAVEKKLHPESAKIAPNKTIYNTVNTSSSSSSFSARERVYTGSVGKRPKIELKTFGTEVVKMTLPQYQALRDLIGEEELYYYLMKLEWLITSSIAPPEMRCHSAYHTIKRWIKADTSL